MKYEVVCTKNYLDVGLLIKKDGTKPKKILSRNSTHGLGSCYGGVEKIKWIHTGVFLSKDEWNKITLDKPTNRILCELNITKSIYKIVGTNSISWYQLWERIGKQSIYKTRNTKVKVLTDGELKECVLKFTNNGREFYLEILE